MFRQLHTAKRCELFNELSKVIWDQISDYHKLGCDSSELGITKYILRELKRFSNDVIRNFQMYAKPGDDEARYGSDIDLYIGIGGGRYRWVALQAKLLKCNGIYNTMKDGYRPADPHPSYQWEKLNLLEAVSGCTSYYLFYNGSSNGFTYVGMDKCDQPFKEEDFGCSIVEAGKIREDMESRLNNIAYQNPRFQDYHPSIARPWRTLVCCPHYTRKDNFTPYYREDIDGSIEGYEKIEAPLELDAFETRALKEREKQFIEEELQVSKRSRPKELVSIVDSSKQANWNPQYKIVVNTTQDSDQNG